MNVTTSENSVNPLPKAGKASKYILTADYTREEPYQPFLRVSTCQQGKRQNLLGQEIHLTRILAQAGRTILPPIRFEWSGRGMERLEKTFEASNQAQKYGAILLAATTDRFIRSCLFRSNHRLYCQAQASEEELQDWKLTVGNTPVMTHLHPDSTPGECKALLTLWGLAVKDKEPGYKKRRKLDLKAKVIELRLLGWGYQRIGKTLQVTRTTVEKWVKEESL